MAANLYVTLAPIDVNGNAVTGKDIRLRKTNSSGSYTGTTVSCTETPSSSGKYVSAAIADTLAGMGNYEAWEYSGGSPSSKLYDNYSIGGSVGVVDAIGSLQSDVDGKASSTHNHDTTYYTQSAVDSLLSTKATIGYSLADYGINDAMTAASITAALSAKADTTTLNTHTSNISNPHSVIASQINIVDAGALITATEMEAALQEIATSLVAQGQASGVTIADVENLIDATDVEGALEEIAGDVQALSTGTTLSGLQAQIDSLVIAAGVTYDTICSKKEDQASTSDVAAFAAIAVPSYPTIRAWCRGTWVKRSGMNTIVFNFISDHTDTSEQRSMNVRLKVDGVEINTVVITGTLGTDGANQCVFDVTSVGTLNGSHDVLIELDQTINVGSHRLTEYSLQATNASLSNFFNI